MRKSGYYDLLMKRINDYNRARTNKAEHQLVLSSGELPLTDTSSSHHHTKMIAVNSLLLQIGKDPSGSIVDMSNRELNMIERVWSRMKWYFRKHADGSLETLERRGLSEDNLPLSLIRKYCRLLSANYIAYKVKILSKLTHGSGSIDLTEDNRLEQ
jgi:hypothetical protein